MRMYSAGEAIGPAWEHTKALLWQDRNKKRFLKICLVAFGAEISGLNFNFNSFGRHGNTSIPSGAAAILAVLGIVIALVSLLIGLALFYLSSRLQFVLFDIVLLRDDRVAPAWKRHRHQTWRWMGVKATAAVAIALALSPFLVPVITAFVAIMHSVAPSGAVQGVPGFSWSVLRPFLLLFAEAFIVIFAFVIFLRFFSNIALPGVALEDLRYGAAFRRAWDLFRSDPGGMLLFLVLQPLFLMLLGIAGGICIAISTVIVAIPFAVLGGLAWLLVHKSGIAAFAVLGLLGGLAFLVLFAWFLLCELAVVGTLYTFSRAWALYFLGGRYPYLGQYLEPSAAVPVWTPPVSLPRDDDDSSGPDLPTSPALA